MFRQFSKIVVVERLQIKPCTVYRTQNYCHKVFRNTCDRLTTRIEPFIGRGTSLGQPRYLTTRSRPWTCDCKDPGPMKRIFCKYFTTSAADSDSEDDNMDGKSTKRTRNAVNDQAKKKQTWEEAKASYLKMTTEDRRKVYKSKHIHTLSNVMTWPEYYKEHEKKLTKTHGLGKHGKAFSHSKGKLEHLSEQKSVDKDLNDKISLWKGDITSLEIDAITNAANTDLRVGGGVDGAIHHAAGKLLRHECDTLEGCEPGQAKITGGYKLPAKYVIHTVGPIGKGDETLTDCYNNTLKELVEHDLRSVAFPCISTGVYGFPNKRAAKIALKTTRQFLEENGDKIDRIIFCLFMPKDVEIYDFYMQEYFPIQPRQTTGGPEGGATTSNPATKSSGDTDMPEAAKSSKSALEDKSSPNKSGSSGEGTSVDSPGAAEAKSGESPEKSAENGERSIDQSDKSENVDKEGSETPTSEGKETSPAENVGKTSSSPITSRM